MAVLMSIGPVAATGAGGARGIIFMVDSSNITKQVRDVAEFLHSILSLPVVRSNRPGLLVMCNKQDLGLAKSCQVIKGLLEKEIDKVRVSRSNQLEGQEDDSGNRSVPLGRPGKAFVFGDLGSRVNFVE